VSVAALSISRLPPPRFVDLAARWTKWGRAWR